MKNKIQLLFKGLSAAAVVTTTCMVGTRTLAATFVGTFTVTTDPSAPLPASTYTGTYSFNSSSQVPTGVFTPNNGSLELSFPFVNLGNSSLSKTYTAVDDYNFGEFDLPQLTVNNGIVTGLEYSAIQSVGDFLNSKSVGSFTFDDTLNNSLNVNGTIVVATQPGTTQLGNGFNIVTTPSTNANNETFVYSVNNSGIFGTSSVQFSVPSVPVSNPSFSTVPEPSNTWGLSLLGLGMAFQYKRLLKHKQDPG